MKLSDNTLNAIYSLGAAIVILGALFKIVHIQLPLGLTGNMVLGFALVVEALVFILYAFFPPSMGKAYDWERVYPELADPNAAPKRVVAQTQEVQQMEVSLSQKLDKMLADAKIDASLFESLRQGIEKFSGSVDEINQTVDISTATKKYNDQLALAASHLENMNALYSVQLNNNKDQAELTKGYLAKLQESAAQSSKFNDELNGLTANLNNLNKVYGGMLSAMKG